MLGGALAQDSSDLYLDAYQDFQTGEKLEREGKPREALGKYEVAGKALLNIRKDAPDWQPLVVEYRLKKTQEAITRLQTEVANLPPPVESIEGPMPEPDLEPTRMPQVSTVPRVVAPRSTPSQRASSQDREGSSRTSSSTLDREIRQMRQQLEEARAENKRLAGKLEQKAGELQMALVTNDKTKVLLVELKTELAQATVALENAKKDGSADAATQAQFDKRAADILKKLAETEAGNEVLVEENSRLLAKLEQAATYISSSDEIRAGLIKDREKMAGERDEAVQKAKKSKDNSAEIARLAGENKDLKTKLTETEKVATAKGSDADKLLQENKSLTNKLAEALMNTPKQAELEKLKVQKNLLQARLAELEKSSREVPAANAEKEKLIASLQSDLKAANGKLAEALANAPKQAELEKLKAQKTQLEVQLAEMEKAKRETPGAADPEKEKQIVTLQSDLNSAKDKLLEAQAQVSQGDEKLRDLQKQLDQATGELAQLTINPTPSKDEKNLIVENELLRNIILRQIKEQTRRDEAAKAIEIVLNSTPTKPDGLSPHLAVLSEPTLKLTEEERAIFKDPVSLLTQPAGDESLSVTMAVTKPTAEEARQNNRPEKATKGDALPEEVRAQFEQAKKLFEAQDFAGAEKVFQDIVESVPNNYYILSNLGAVQIESGKLSAAEVALKKAIQINEVDSYAHRNLGIVYSRQGRIDAAIAALRRSVAADERDAVAHNYLGVCLGQKEDRQDAEKEFKRAITIDPEYAAAHFNLAVLYATTQPPALKLAKQHYSRATELGAPPDASLERLIQ